MSNLPGQDESSSRGRQVPIWEQPRMPPVGARSFLIPFPGLTPLGCASFGPLGLLLRCGAMLTTSDEYQQTLRTAPNQNPSPRACRCGNERQECAGWAD